MNYKVIAEKIETVSGAFVLARSDFNELLGLAADEKLSVIVVDIPDRLGRGDVIAKLELMAQLNGARVEYATPGRDTSTIEGLALKATEQLVSGIERLNIRRRTMSGRTEWARRGRIIQSAFRPYGYQFESEYDEHGRKISCRLAIVEEEAQVVRLIYHLCAHDCLTITAIARRLTEMGIPRMRGKNHPSVKNARAGWSRTSVHEILTSRLYVGEWRYGKNRIDREDTIDGIRTHLIKRDLTETVVIAVPAIVNEQLWEAVRKQLSSNNTKFRKPTVRQYLLRGRLHCALCGGNYLGETRMFSKPYVYYRCRKTLVDYASDRCIAKLVRGDVIEPIVWEIVCKALLDEDRLIAGLTKRREETSKARRMLEQLVATIELQIQKAKTQLDRLLDLYTNGELDKDTYMSKKRKIEKELEQRQAEKQELTDRLGEYIMLTPEFEEELRRFRADVERSLAGDIPFETKAKLLDMLKVHCIFNQSTGDLTVSGLLGSHTLSVRS